MATLSLAKRKCQQVPGRIFWMGFFLKETKKKKKKKALQKPLPALKVLLKWFSPDTYKLLCISTLILQNTEQQIYKTTLVYSGSGRHNMVVCKRFFNFKNMREEILSHILIQNMVLYVTIHPTGHKMSDFNKGTFVLHYKYDKNFEIVWSAVRDS